MDLKVNSVLIFNNMRDSKGQITSQLHRHDNNGYLHQIRTIVILSWPRTWLVEASQGGRLPKLGKSHLNYGAWPQN